MFFRSKEVMNPVIDLRGLFLFFFFFSQVSQFLGLINCNSDKNANKIITVLSAMELKGNERIQKFFLPLFWISGK